jgi:hypothetical protein
LDRRIGAGSAAPGAGPVVAWLDDSAAAKAAAPCEEALPPL